ncbi:hypothetical protein GCM10009846_01130 [Agrococcus versicolor]|uniref:DUF4190 domain-containing protein n=1 Tax=Agrococcus versicolor TaxID=501482 RepID=A0ABP5MDQ4_9MICO
MFDVAALLTSIVSVLVVGIVLGAGIPTIYALGAAQLELQTPRGRALGWTAMGVCVLLAAMGIVMIVWGKALFGI